MNRELYELLTVKQYALLRGVSERTVREWIKKKWVDAERTTGSTYGQWRIKILRAS